MSVSNWRTVLGAELLALTEAPEMALKAGSGKWVWVWVWVWVRVWGGEKRREVEGEMKRSEWEWEWVGEERNRFEDLT